MRFEKKYGYQTHREGVITEVPTQKIYPKSTIPRRCWFQKLWHLAARAQNIPSIPLKMITVHQLSNLKLQIGKQGIGCFLIRILSAMVFPFAKFIT
jgi:hypothetical protein